MTLRAACGGERPQGSHRLARLWRRAAETDGYSLVELIVALAIMTIVVGALTQLMVSGTNAQLDMTRRFEAQQEARLALDSLRREIHCASKLEVPSASWPQNSIKITLGSSCLRNPGQVITWCTLGSGSRHELWRKPGPACGSSAGVGDVKKADYLTTGNVFTGYTVLTPEQRRKLSVRLPVDVAPAKTGGTYTLEDDIVLRNVTRGT